MDSSGSEEIIFWFKGIGEYSTWLPPSVPVSGMHRAVLEGDFLNVKRWIESGESVNKQETQSNLSALHMAVVENNLEILEYLLARDDVDVDIRCCKGSTPLNLATTLGYMESVEKLIQAGSDANIPDYEYNTPLHMSVYCPDACHLLIRSGARIDATNSWGRTLLHQAVWHNLPEIMHMLLYYNADANIPDRYGLTPFMTAIMCHDFFIQELLLEYVDDFNRTNRKHISLACTLSLALRANSPFVKDMIERGVNVNYGDDPKFDDWYCALSTSLFNPVDLVTFKLVWERLHYNDNKATINIFDFLNYNRVPTYLQVVIESDNFEPVVKYFSNWKNYFSFVDKFAERKLDFEQLTCLTCHLFQCGYRASSYDIHAIFSNYGYCELFRILLYMDNDFRRGWLPRMALTRLIFDVHYDLKSVATQVNDIPKDTVVQLLEYSICPRLIDALTVQYSEDENMSVILGNLPTVPSLIELARNASRKQIWQLFKINSACQFYTTIDHLDVPTFCKAILTFKKKIYSIKT